MDNNMNMFPEDPLDDDVNGMPDDNDDIDFGETLEDFENLIGTEASENNDAGDNSAEMEDSGEDDENKNEAAKNGKNDKNGKIKEKKEFPKLKIDTRTVSGIFRGIGAWIAAVWRMLSSRTKIVSITSFAAVVVGIIILVVVLNNSPYSVIIQNLNDSEFGTVTDVLTANQIPFRNERETDGLVDVYIRESDEANAVRYLSQSGFRSTGIIAATTESTGGMFETAEDKRQRIIRDKESRLISVFNAMDGVVSSMVMLDIPDNSKSVLLKEIQPSGASVTLFLEPGVTLSNESVKGIERIVMMYVENLTQENIIIADGQARILNKYEEETSGQSIDYISMLKIKTDYERDLERKLEEDVVFMLESGFPEARAKVTVNTNFDKVLRETMEYLGANVDDETGEMTGIKSAVAVDRILRSGEQDENVFGTVGTDSNTDATGYYETPLDTALGDFADEMHITHEDLVGHIMEQIERTTPEITNISLMATADGRNVLGVPIPEEDIDIDEWTLFLANGTGITNIARSKLGEDETLDAEYLRNNFVSIIIRPYYTPLGSPEVTTPAPGIFSMFEFWLAVGALLILVIMVAVILVAIARRAKRIREEEAEELLAENVPAAAYDRGDMDAFAMAIGKSAVADEFGGTEVPLEIKEENLRRQIRIFVDQNPEIAAQLVKTLLKGDEANG